MKKLVLLLLLTATVFFAFAQADLLSTQQKLLKELVAKQHFSPRQYDDKFFNDFFSSYLKSLDDERLFFTAADLQKLAGLRKSLADDWNGNSTVFFQASSQLYKTKLLAAKTIVADVCAKPFDFSLPDVFKVSDMLAAATDKALANRWSLLLKSEVLQSLMNIGLNQWQTKKSINKTEVLAKEPELRARIKAKYLARIDGLLQSDATYDGQMRSLYLNTFLHCFDPHSDFFDLATRQQFKEAVSSDGLVFGFALTENDRGEACISNVAPGSAAWACGVLNKGDVPVRLQWEGSNPVDLTGLEVEDIHALLGLHTKEKMELTVRKGNGQQQTVVLQKQKLANDDNVVKSFVLSGAQNIGYVMLPSFYTEWEDRSGSRCAADVAREIVKLKKDSIAGLILDLRFNGGGSLQEAIEMAGIFIDEGVICQVKDNKGKIEALKDMNRGVIYNGPLLVLVNGQSASASELVAAALQDYHRAIIAGSPTFGKATGQAIFPLQETSYSGADKTGFAKITDLKLYRPTGQSAQRKGVQPDVLIPDVYGREEREADEPFALPADTIAAYKYFKPMNALNLSGLQQQSAARLNEAVKFAEAKRTAAMNTSYRKRTSFSLKWDDAEKEIKAISAGVGEKIFSQPSAIYRVRNNTADLHFASSLSTDLRAFWLQRLSADMYIEEAVQILSDLIQSK